MSAIRRREFLKSGFAAAAAGLLGAPALQALGKMAAEQKLNVLFIMTDQHNVRALSCYGNPVVKTPNLDRIAAGGVRFTNAFTQTGQCCPSRYTIWTGRYAHSHGCRWNGVVEPLDEITIGELCSQAGYATASIGKHHMMHSPVEHGFAHVVDQPEYHKAMHAKGAKAFTENAEWVNPILGGITRNDNEDTPPGFWATETIKFMRENKDKPFYVQSSFYGPHTPILPAEPWASMYDPGKMELPPNFNYESDSLPKALTMWRGQYSKMTDDDHRKMLALYYGFVSQIDHNIGRMLDELDKLGLAGKTLVIFTADHGEMMAEHHAWTKTVANYDATIHIPMLARLPGVLPAGKVSGDLVGLVDLMPTMCGLLGLKTPKKVQGSDLRPQIEGKAKSRREVIFSEIGYPGKPVGYSVMARSKTAKLIVNEGKGPRLEQFFNLAKDPWEMKNEIGNPAYAKTIGKLKKALDDWQKNTDHAPMYPIENEAKKPRNPGAGKNAAGGGRGGAAASQRGAAKRSSGRR